MERIDKTWMQQSRRREKVKDTTHLLGLDGKEDDAFKNKQKKKKLKDNRQ